MARAPLLVIDGDNLAHRAFHALPPLEGAGGRPVSAMLGFANMLLQAVDQERPRSVLVGWDSLPHPTYRNELYPPYQAQRPAFAEPLVEQLDELPSLVEAFGFANAKAPGYEADDFLAAAAAKETAAGGRALVLTGDRDAYQLVSDRVMLLFPERGTRELRRVGPDEVRERYGVEPAQVPDFIALRGDPSDNLPGAAGIGAKTAAELLRRHGSLDALIELARRPTAREHGLTPRQAASLQDENLPLFRRIATMDANAPLELPPDGGVDWERAAEYVERIGTMRLAERLRGRAAGSAAP
jgi:DNA polymerase-1